MLAQIDYRRDRDHLIFSRIGLFVTLVLILLILLIIIYFIVKCRTVCFKNKNGVTGPNNIYEAVNVV